jgi:hypothetical protein
MVPAAFFKTDCQSPVEQGYTTGDGMNHDEHFYPVHGV